MQGSQYPVVIVDDDLEILESFRLMLQFGMDMDAVAIERSPDVLPYISEHGASAVVLDLVMPELSGEELLETIVREHPDLPVIVTTGINDVQKAVQCIKGGAHDYLVKPVNKDKFLLSVKNAIELGKLRGEVSSLKRQFMQDKVNFPRAFSDIVTINPKMRRIFQYTEAVSVSSHPVLITGETGVGKEMLARAVHDLSGARGGFVPVNVAGLDDQFFSDMIFGHSKGAFTGAAEKRDGLIKKAQGGTLFLDEVGDLSPASQVKLLRLLQEREYYPIGSDTPIGSNARILASTNKAIEAMAQDGSFRRDLYYRLASHLIELPPLRERLSDISLLTAYFIKHEAEQMGKVNPVPPPELFQLLMTYHFPGNVRELQAMVRDAVAQHKSGMLSMESFRKHMKRSRGKAHAETLVEFSETPTILLAFQKFPTEKEVEDYLTEEAMKISGGNQGVAASLLGITRQTLNRRLRKKTKE